MTYVKSLAADIATANEFLKWLESRNLSICNASNAIFWPVDTDRMATRFAARDA